MRCNRTTLRTHYGHWLRHCTPDFEIGNAVQEFLMVILRPAVLIETKIRWTYHTVAATDICRNNLAGLRLNPK